MIENSKAKETNELKESVTQIVKQLKLKPHPEGGFFRETYRSQGIISKESFENIFPENRNYSTAIYFLLTSDSFSAFHRIKSDEIWHFYKGSPLFIHMISPEGEYTMIELGTELSKAQTPQFTVPAGYWFAAKVNGCNTFSLVGCTVAPGFDFQDFEMAEREKLSTDFPQHKEIIKKMTR